MKKLIIAALLMSCFQAYSHGDEKNNDSPAAAVSHQRIVQQFSELFKEGDATILQGYISNTFTLHLVVNNKGVLELSHVESLNPMLINYATEAFKNSKIAIDSTFVGEKLTYNFKIN